MTVGQKIKQLRLAHGLTTSQLAEMLWVDRGSVRRWERDENEPHLYALIGMADIFGVTLDELCCRGRMEE